MQDAADEGDVAIQVARRLTDDDVQFGAVAAVRRVIASGAEDAVAVGNPGAVFFCGDREAVGKADFFRPAVRIGQGGEVQPLQRALKFCREFFWPRRATVFVCRYRRWGRRTG